MRKSCKKCGHHWFWHLSDGRYKCRACGQRQSFCSVWNSCRLSEANKRKLLEYFVLGVPAYRLRFRMKAFGSPVSLEATERFFLLIRQTMALLEECAAPLEGSVECDESAFGGKRKGKRGWGAAGKTFKTLVFGLLKRNGVVRVFAVDNRRKATLLPLIEAHTAVGCLYYTDDYQAYASLKVRGEHVVVTKDKGVPKGRDHINGLMALRAFGAMPKTGFICIFICIVACPKSLCIFIWLKLLIVSTIVNKTFTPCYSRR